MFDGSRRKEDEIVVGNAHVLEWRKVREELSELLEWYFKNRQLQNSAFLQRMDGRREKFYDFMISQLVKTYKLYVKKLESAESIEPTLRSFFQPTNRENT